MTVALYYLIIFIYGTHICVDVMCLVCTLLDPFLWSVFHTKTSITQDSDTETVDTPTRWPALKQAWEKIIFLYPSLFKDPNSVESLILVRYFLYWNVCSSIVKLVFLVYPTFSLIILITILYIFDCFVYEYEGFTANSLNYQKARLMTLFSFGMSILSLFMCLWID